MPFDSNPEFARLLGLILERWTTIEATLADCLAALLDGNVKAARAIVFSLNSTSIRIAMVRAVAKELVPDGPEKRGLLYLLDKINDLQKQRNEFIHGEYWHGEVGSYELELVLIRPMNSETFTYRPVSLAHLSGHLNLIEERQFQLELAIAPDPERRIPRMLRIRLHGLSRYKMRHAAATERNHAGR